jgi:pimeloyl-ACP methyl ester carboxylesterase
MIASAFTLDVPCRPVIRGQRWAGDQRWVLLVHQPGTKRDLDDWRHVIAYLLKEGVTAAAIDLPGHGLSEGDWTSDRAAADARRFIEWAHREGASSISLIGSGESGVTALKLASEGSIDALVLVSPPSVESSDYFSLRGAGVPKLIISGGKDPVARSAANELRDRSIGWALTVSLPTVDQGAALVAGPFARRAGEVICHFLRERWAMAATRYDRSMFRASSLNAQSTATGKKEVR